MQMDLKQATLRARNSTVRISAQFQPDPKKLEDRTLGAGLIAGADGWIVTALHVVKEADNLLHGKEGARLMVGFPGPHRDGPGIEIRGAFLGRTAAVVDTDVSNDLALLQIAPKSIKALGFTVGPEELPATPEPFEFDVRRPEIGELVASSGYPLGEFSLVTTSGPIANALAMDPGTRQDRYLVDMTANPGNSGGPVYRVDDVALVGVCVAGKTVMTRDGNEYAAGLTIVVPSKAVADLLERNGISLA